MAEVPDLSSDEDQFDEDEWQEMESGDVSIICLFCPTEFPNIEEAFKHCESTHNFRMNSLRQKFSMDCYSYIKLINYIKTHKPDPDVIMNTERVLWGDEAYLKPVDNDEWLTYDFESLSESIPSPGTFHANVENGLVTLSQKHFDELHKTIHNLNEQLKESQVHLQMAKEDMDKMKQSVKTLVDSATNNDNVVANCVSKVALEDDQGYFNSYAHFGIHYEMLSDKVRTDSYRQAILNNKEILKDKVVLDLGCGTGILSMFAATAGAKTVYALDQSDIVSNAKVIIRENNLHDIIKVVKGRLEDTELEEKVDVIISEWMGYFLLFEAMLDSVIYARDHCLKPNGLLLPNRCNMSLVAGGDMDKYKSFIEFWSDVYGYKMNCIKSDVIKEASVDCIDEKYILSAPCVVKEIDIMTCTISVMDFSAGFSLVISKDGFLTCLVGYFDTFFDLPCKVDFSTGPHVTPTHWKQTVFHFRDTKAVKKGDVIEGTIICNRRKDNLRSMDVHITIFGKSHKYILN